jgi:hypothetical protein
MNSVSQVSNLAQFVRLVSEARTRNGTVAANTQRKLFSSSLPRPQAFSNATPLSMYSRPGQTSAVQAVDGAAKPVQTRNLGTKFDAYA